MRWQIAQFIFCEQQQSLTLDDDVNPQVIQLEPMMVELLSYFCHHPDQIVSKDALIEHVWLGRIVSDNAVSRLVTKLRKVLGDDPKQPRFIATFPKKGYKFIAKATAINEQVLQSVVEEVSKSTEFADQNRVEEVSLPVSTHSTATKPLGYRTVIGILMTVTIAIVLYMNLSGNEVNNLPANSAKAITTDAGNELFPAVSPDGSRVAYMLSQNRRVKLILKRLADQQQIDVTHGEGVGVGPASWNDDGTKIAYLVATPQRCQYFIREVSDLTLGEAKLIHNCPAGSYGKIKFTHDDNRLVFAETAGSHQGYSLFEINLATQKVKRLNQPEVVLGGNSQFDIHPTENKLLISSPDRQQWEGFYSLNLDTGDLRLLFKQDAYICCGIWSHDGQRVVLMGEHPAYQILSYDMTGKNRQVIYSGSRQISWPLRHTNGADYLFSSGNGNEDIYAISLDDLQTSVLADSSVDEHLATYSPERNQIAYISFASGNEEVWLADTDTSKEGRTPAKKLTNFSDSRHYVDLLWSPSGERLLALMLNEIHVIDGETGDYTRLKLPQSEIRGVSFKSSTQIAYSIKEEGKWRVHVYDIETHSTQTLDSQWQFVRYHQNKEDILWLDQANKLYVGEVPVLLENTTLQSNHLLNGRQFNLIKRGDNYFWYEYAGVGNIMHYSATTNELSKVTQSDSPHFTLAENKLVFGSTQRGSVDIYQTQLIAR